MEKPFHHLQHAIAKAAMAALGPTGSLMSEIGAGYILVLYVRVT